MMYLSILEIVDDFSDNVSEMCFNDAAEIASFLLDNYKNTGNEVSINDSIFLGVGTDTYMYSDEVPATVSATVEERNSTFSNLVPGTENLSAAIDAIYEKEKMLVLYA